MSAWTAWRAGGQLRPHVRQVHAGRHRAPLRGARQGRRGPVDPVHDRRPAGQSDDYTILEDDQSLLPAGNVLFVASQEAADEAGPDFGETIEKVQESLTLEVMQELNARVSLDREKPEDVAADYLQEAGYIAVAAGRHTDGERAGSQDPARFRWWARCRGSWEAHGTARYSTSTERSSTATRSTRSPERVSGAGVAARGRLAGHMLDGPRRHRDLRGRHAGGARTVEQRSTVRTRRGHPRPPAATWGA